MPNIARLWGAAVWVSRLLYVFFLAAACVVGPLTAHSASDDKEYLIDVRAKLEQELLRLGGQNYRSADQQHIELVDQGKAKNLPIPLKAGTTYAIVVACDKDCTHVALSLRDEDGRVLVESREQHHTVIVTVTPQRTAHHTAHVSVPGCGEDECYIGFHLLSLDRERGTSLETTGSVSFTAYDNYDLVGADLRQVRDANLTDCISACSSDSKCKAYSFDKWNHMCFLKSTVNLLRLEPNTISGTRIGVMEKPIVSSLPITMQRYRNKAFPWKGQRSRSVESFEQCEQLCREQTSCVALTYFKDIKQCRLMESTEAYSSNSNADSAIKRQQTRQPLTSTQLIEAIQRELKRVGCDPREIDGEWGDNTESALASFAKRAAPGLPSDAPSERALSLIAAQDSNVCSS